MKKLLFSTALLLSFCYLLSQTNNSLKDKQSITEDVLLLQKSNALLKIQLNEQKHTLLKQIQKTDSIISILQSTNSEIKKGVDNQYSITQCIYNLKEQTTNISQALSERKFYSIIAFIGSIIIVLIYLFYLKKKSVAINKNIKQNVENLNKQLSQMNENIDKEIGEIKVLVEKQTKEINLAIEKQNTENKEMLTKQLADTKDNINKMNNEINKTIENQILSVKRIFHEQLSQSANEFSEKITDVNKTIEKKIASIKNDISTNINEINEKLKNTNLNKS
jgi:hypothetical protein